MNELIPAIREIVGLFRELMDPEKRKSLYELKEFKNKMKALDIAEEIFLVVDSMRATKGLKDIYEKHEERYLKLKKKFNKYD